MIIVTACWFSKYPTSQVAETIFGLKLPTNMHEQATNYLHKPFVNTIAVRMLKVRQVGIYPTPRKRDSYSCFSR